MSDNRTVKFLFLITGLFFCVVFFPSYAQEIPDGFTPPPMFEGDPFLPEPEAKPSPRSAAPFLTVLPGDIKNSPQKIPAQAFSVKRTSVKAPVPPRRPKVLSVPMSYIHKVLTVDDSNKSAAPRIAIERTLPASTDKLEDNLVQPTAEEILNSLEGVSIENRSK
jgi:hypothetical protein